MDARLKTQSSGPREKLWIPRDLERITEIINFIFERYTDIYDLLLVSCRPAAQYH